MSNTESGDKIMGIIPKNRYVYFAYMFLLVSAAGNVLFSLLSIVGLDFDSAGYAVMVLSILAAALAVLGVTLHKAEFNAQEHEHFKYMILVFALFFVVYLVCGGLYGISYFLGYLVTALIGAAQAVLVWTGYNSWQDGRVITKDNIKDEIKLAIAKR